MHLKKKFGQHLLIAEPTIEKIVKTLAPLKEDDLLEIGPGTGKLTRHLLKNAGRVTVIDTDREMVEILKENFPSAKNLEIVHADFLKINLSSLFHQQPNRVIFCGNLPYNISTPILFKLKENRSLFSRGVVMVQKEVALRLTARPSTKDYGILAILMQSVADIKKCFDVSPGSFIPPPKVFSSVVSIKFYDLPRYEIKDESVFTKIVREAFSKRRKMIRNTVHKEYLPYLEEAGIDPKLRPEDVPIEDYARLSSIVKKCA